MALGALAGGLAGASPWGAAASAAAQIAATPTSATSSTGPVNIGGLDFGPSQNSTFAQYALLGVAFIAIAVVATRGKGR